VQRNVEVLTAAATIAHKNGRRRTHEARHGHALDAGMTKLMRIGALLAVAKRATITPSLATKTRRRLLHQRRLKSW
jgi:3-dehydroquinate synthetase